VSWPGPNCVEALVHGTPLTGIWHDRTSESEARRRGRKVRFQDHRTEEVVDLDPLPCWRHLPPEEIRQRIRHMVREIEDETAERHRRNGIRPLGRKPVQQIHPHDAPDAVRLPPVRLSGWPTPPRSGPPLVTSSQS